MLKNENIICISSIDWDFIWQGHQEIMSTFAKNGNKVLYIENTGVRRPNLRDLPRLKKRVLNWLKGTKGFRLVQENLYVYSPLILPFPYSFIARRINRFLLVRSLKRWMGATGFYNPVIWTFLPTGTALEIIRSIEKKLLVYYCIADFNELADPKKVSKSEELLLKQADVVFAQNKFLKQKCEKFNNNVQVFPFGVNLETFTNYKTKEITVPPQIKGLKKPVIGYIGGIHRHIDFDLIRQVALKRPEWSFVFVGILQVPQEKIELIRLANVHLAGKKDFSELPAYLQQFDVCIIPYLISEYTKSVFPTKLNEYHAMGKPVVSTPLPDLLEYNKNNLEVISLASGAEEFTRKIEEAISSNSAELELKRIALARVNNWTERISLMSRAMEEDIRLKEKNLRDNWSLKFMQFYLKTRRKIIFTAAVTAFSIFVLFYTPLAWFIAAPLKVETPLAQADAITVFAGGVGESGQAGQGYEERVKFAVDLYKKGLADKLIFSSGYMYFFEEPVVMKALAVSLGVPEKDIILESKATSTYENVIFTQRIAASRGWKRIILITSPYNTRRVELLFKKNFPSSEVILAPIPQSKFFSEPENAKAGPLHRFKKINLRQIRAILHEYLAIGYYYLKGYI